MLRRALLDTKGLLRRPAVASLAAARPPARASARALPPRRSMVDVPLARRVGALAPYDGPPHTAARYASSDGVATITLAQPDNKNALNAAMVDAIGDHLATAAASDTRAVFLHACTSGWRRVYSGPPVENVCAVSPPSRPTTRCASSC